MKPLADLNAPELADKLLLVEQRIHVLKEQRRELKERRRRLKKRVATLTALESEILQLLETSSD